MITSSSTQGNKKRRVTTPDKDHSPVETSRAQGSKARRSPSPRNVSPARDDQSHSVVQDSGRVMKKAVQPTFSSSSSSAAPPSGITSMVTGPGTSTPTSVPSLLAGMSASSSSAQKMNQDKQRQDARWMKMAVEEGEKGRLVTAPNPWVGVVIVHDPTQTLLGVGHHKGPGTPHAEPNAIADAEGNFAALLPRLGSDSERKEDNHKDNMFENCTLYSTLEPCHRGPGKRTPPCDELIVAKKIPRVCIGVVDTDATFGARKGIAFLQKNGVEVCTVEGGIIDEVDEDACKSCIDHVDHDQHLDKSSSTRPFRPALDSLRPYLHQRVFGTPYVVLKIACSMDGKIACADSTSQWITDAPAREDSHLRFRARSQAMLVGSGTYLKDKPRLNVRVPSNSVNHVKMLKSASTTSSAGGEQQRAEHQDDKAGPGPVKNQTPILQFYDPLRVVLDSRGRLATLPDPLTAGENPWLLFTHQPKSTFPEHIQQSAEIVCLQQERAGGLHNLQKDQSSRRENINSINLQEVLQFLGKEKKVLQVTVEGGSALQGSFLQENLVQEVAIYQGACLLGSSGIPWATAPLTSTISEALFWELKDVSRHGERDVLLQYGNKQWAEKLEAAFVSGSGTKAPTT